MMPVKADLAICVALSLVCLDNAGVWLSCQAIIWISGLWRVFLQIRSHLFINMFLTVFTKDLMRYACIFCLLICGNSMAMPDSPGQHFPHNACLLSHR